LNVFSLFSHAIRETEIYFVRELASIDAEGIKFDGRIDVTYDFDGSSRRPSYRVWTTQFFCLTGLAAVQWQFGD
jgi:hypothetical protein